MVKINIDTSVMYRRERVSATFVGFEVHWFESCPKPLSVVEIRVYR